MKYINLTQGQKTIVDDEDFIKFSTHKWNAHWAPDHRKFYAVGWKDGKKVRLNRVIMDAAIGTTVDHINRIRTDDRISNLREATFEAQNINKIKQRNNSSGFSGVYWRPDIGNGKWWARLHIGRKSISLGVFEDFSDAVEARRLAELKYFKIQSKPIQMCLLL